MEVTSPYKTKEVKFQRNYPGYLYRREIIEDLTPGCPDEMEMVNCYESEKGQWIGDAKTARMLCKKFGLRKIQKIDPSFSSCSIGFNEDEQKWYGWSHRAIYGFGIGSTCNKGDCSYHPVNEADCIEEGIRFWSDDGHLNTRAGIPVLDEYGNMGVLIEWEYTDDVPNKKLRNTTGSTFWNFPDTYGKGEWVAKTLEDAKQMAIDFAEGVS